MSPLLQRLIGSSLVVAATLGLVFNIAAFFFAPVVSQRAEQSVVDSLVVLDGTLTTTENALDLVDNSISTAEGTLTEAEATTRDVARTIQATAPLLATLASVTEEELPNSISATRQSLNAAEEGATTLEVILFTLNNIPLLDLPAYDPEVPLTQSIRDVSGSLDTLPATFREMSSSLESTGRNLEQVEIGIASLADSFVDATSTIDESRLVAAQYREVVEQQKTVLTTTRASVSTWFRWGTYAVQAVLAWLAIAQLGLLSQGAEMVGRSRRE